MRCHADESAAGDPVARKAGLERDAIAGEPSEFQDPDQPCVITVPGDEGKELAPDTLNAILKKAGLK
jgi:predicted RNA binding protein YcfA (HicA-like mRNA interferase family)